MCEKKSQWKEKLAKSAKSVNTFSDRPFVKTNAIIPKKTSFPRNNLLTFTFADDFNISNYIFFIEYSLICS